MSYRVVLAIVVIIAAIVVKESFLLPEWVVMVSAAIVLLLGFGFMDIFRNNRRYESQTDQRREIIRALCDKNDSLEHIALVLSHSNFKDEDGKEIKVDHIQAEYDAIILLEELTGAV